MPGTSTTTLAEAPDSRCTVLGQYPRPDGTLTAPLKGYGYSPRCKCTWCSLTDSYPVSVARTFTSVRQQGELWLRVLENDVTDRREKSSHCHPGHELSIHISSYMGQLAHVFFSERRGTRPKVYIVAVWTESSTRSRGKAGKSVETFSVFLLPVFLDTALGLAHRRVLRIGFCSVVFLFSTVEVSVQSTSLPLIGIERDGKSTRLPEHVRDFRRDTTRVRVHTPN